MANAQRKVTPSFYEVVFKGSPKLTRGFLAGLVMGSEEEATIFFNLDDGIFHEGLGDRVADFISVLPANCHVIMDNKTCARLKKLKRRVERSVGLEIKSFKRIRSGSMHFKFETFGARYYNEITGLVKELPRGLKLSNFEHEVVKDPAAEGIEGYTPVHDFEARGTGDIAGRIDLLIATRREFDKHPLIHVGEIQLTLA
ncbi:MAG: hypothetical protein GY835_11055 [bacterium]|nr:hypothetical protein [bacterium]